MMNLRRLLYGLVVVAVVLVALGLRLWAVERLPQDYDEPVYFLAGQHYATALLEGDWAEFLHYDYNMEHPPLTKLAYAAVLSRLPQIPEIPEQPTNPPPPRPYPLPQPQFVALLMSVPVVAIFVILQRYLLRGLLIGLVEE